MGGGINWTGIGGIIEQCGVYANGVLPLNISQNKFFQKMIIPKYSKREHDHITNPGEPLKSLLCIGAHGILIINVKGTSNGLLITGCEIQRRKHRNIR